MATTRIRRPILSDPNGNVGGDTLHMSKNILKIDTPSSTSVIPYELSTPVPLESSWTFWFHQFKPNQAYDKFLKRINAVATVQEFWMVYNTLAYLPLKRGCSVHVMRNDIQPLWEHPENVNGGLWSFRIPKPRTSEIWQELLLAMIGEQFASILPSTNAVNGITVSARASDNVIQLWMKSDSEHDANILPFVMSLMARANISHAIVPKLSFFKSHTDHADFSSTHGTSTLNHDII